MTERGWFTLVVRAFGLWLTGLGVQSSGYLFYNLYRAMVPDESTNRMYVDGYNGYAVSGGLLLAGGLYLLLGGGWLIDRWCREVVGRCPGCGYDAKAIAAESCPECGAHLPRRPRSMTTATDGDRAAQINT